MCWAALLLTALGSAAAPAASSGPQLEPDTPAARTAEQVVRRPVPVGVPAERSIPPRELRERYDVVIAGAGTGGFGTAMQAARLGATVLLLEETDWIGGQMTAAGVTSMDEGPRDAERGVLVRERGLYREFTDEVIAYYHKLGISAETAYWHARIGMEPRVGQEILYGMLGKARTRTPALHISLRSKVIQVLRKGDAVTGVVVQIETPGGEIKQQVQSRVLVDATEWGDVIPLTGARYRVGNCTGEAVKTNRAIQDITWTAVIKQYPNGVPTELLMTNAPPGYDKAHPHFLKTLVAGEKVNTGGKPWNFATFIGYRGMPNSEQPGGRGITRTHLNYNNDYPTHIGDVEDAASRLRTCRQAMLKTLHLLYYIQQTLERSDWSVANDEGYDSPYQRAQIDRWVKDQPELALYRPILNHFSVMAYARESRRIVGLHTLVASEIERKPRSPKMFENTVALGDYAVDLHGSKTPELLELDLDHLEDIPQHTFGERGLGPFAIPFECFIPETLDGFIAAEKNISQSRLANGATRLQPSTMLMGQAAGAIAGLSVRHGVKPRELDPVLVQRVLLETGDTLHITPLKDVAKSGWEWPAIQLVTVRGLMTLEGGKFFPLEPLSIEALRLLMKRGFNAEPALVHSVTRGDFALLLQPAMAASGVKLTLSTLKEPDGPVMRLEAAEVMSAFLEMRALARLSGREETLSWPVLRDPTPLAPEEMAPRGLADDLRTLIKHRVIDSADYWLTNAVGTSTCDGKRVAVLLRSCAKAIQPAADEAQFLQTCAAAGILNSPDYWKQNAVEGGKCSGSYVAAIIRRAAAQLGAVNSSPSSRRQGGIRNQ